MRTHCQGLVFLSASILTEVLTDEQNDESILAEEELRVWDMLMNRFIWQIKSVQENLAEQA